MADANLGFFIVQNSRGKSVIRDAVWHAFLDRYFPYQPSAAPAVASEREDLGAVSGRYISSRRSETTVISAGTVTEELTISRNDDGTLSVDQLLDLSGQPVRFREIAPLVFREVNGQRLAVFTRDQGGQMVTGSDLPIMTFRKATWYENSIFNLTIFFYALALFALTLVLWPIAAMVRRHYLWKSMLSPRRRRLRILVRTVCVINVAFALGWSILMSQEDNPGFFSSHLDPVLRILVLTGWVGALGTLVILYNALQNWTGKQWWLTRITDSALALACLGFVWFLFKWHMLNWSLNY
jgi:hypothetical protein